MLGDSIGKVKGKITGQRVLSVTDNPIIESTFQESGMLLGIEITDIGTYWAEIRKDGKLYGEGNGVITTKNGDIVTWIGQGVGKMNGKAIEWRGSLFYNTSSDSLSRLNSLVGVFEHNVDEQANFETEIWEWI